mmetsp:Transcript_40954/g.80762  ORF Transcript_40954/g.80762 Transcript_40954/m.80762 type:complete len:137 (-) Transcript_40954:1035-1445(-)
MSVYVSLFLSVSLCWRETRWYSLLLVRYEKKQSEKAVCLSLSPSYRVQDLSFSFLNSLLFAPTLFGIAAFPFPSRLAASLPRPTLSEGRENKERENEGSVANKRKRTHTKQVGGDQTNRRTCRKKAWLSDAFALPV